MLVITTRYAPEGIELYLRGVLYTRSEDAGYIESIINKLNKTNRKVF